MGLIELLNAYMAEGLPVDRCHSRVLCRRVWTLLGMIMPRMAVNSSTFSLNAAASPLPGQDWMDFAFSTVETGEKVLRGVMEHSTSKCDVVVILAAFVRIIVSTRFCRLPPPPHLLDIPGQQLGRQLIPSLGLLAGSWHGDHVVISN